jgi:hypothetical protein
MFFVGIAWLTVLLGVSVVSVGRARTTAERLVALDTAASRYLGDRRPFTEPEEEGPG